MLVLINLISKYTGTQSVNINYSSSDDQKIAIGTLSVGDKIPIHQTKYLKNINVSPHYKFKSSINSSLTNHDSITTNSTD